MQQTTVRMRAQCIMGAMSTKRNWDADEVRLLIKGVSPELLPDNEQLRMLLRLNDGNGWWAAADAIMGIVLAMGTSGALDTIKADNFSLGGSEKTLNYLTELATKYRERGDEEDGSIAIVFPPDEALGVW